MHHIAGVIYVFSSSQLYQADTVKWELGSKTVAVDFTLPEGISVQLEEVEERVNLYIRENRAVSSRVVKRDEVGTVEMLRGMEKSAMSCHVTSCHVMSCHALILLLQED